MFRTPRSPRRRQPTRVNRAVTAGLVTCLLLAGLGSTASASSGRTSESQEHPAGRFYGNFEIGVLLFTGGGVEEICTGGPEPLVPARITERRDGTVVLRAKTNEMPFVLYRSGLGAPEFIEQTCLALFDDDPGTEPIQPFARGVGKFRERIVTSTDGVEQHQNGVWGLARDDDGAVWRVRSWADFIIDNGELLGDPAEFQGLTLRSIG